MAEESERLEQAHVDSALDPAGLAPNLAQDDPSPSLASEALEGEGVSDADVSLGEPLPTIQPGDTTRVRDRIKVLTDRAKASDDKSAASDRRIAALEAQLSQVFTPLPASTESVGDMPLLANFGEDTEGYIDALTTWKAKGEVQTQLAARDAAQRKGQESAQQAAQKHDWDTQVGIARRTHEDYDTIIRAAAAVEVESPALNVLLSNLGKLTNGVEVLYALSKEPGRLTALSQLPVMEASAELVLASRALRTEGSPDPPPQVKPRTVDTPVSSVTPAGGGRPAFREGDDYSSYLLYRKGLLE